ncbi:hypothetical protein EO087_06050 [Dyella sp. M7H15-1]|nr:hypothetical protein EO087_06050 [Dyella sp. M7H15-1]
MRANPLAGDTQEGITQWWLGLDPSSTEQVAQALAWLEAEGLLEAVQQTDGLVHYRRTVQDAATEARLDQLIRDTTVP